MAFIGIKIPHEVGRLLKAIDVDGKKVPDSEYHITIALFSEDWPVSEAAKSLEATYKVLKKVKPFKVSVKKVSCFPGGANGVPVFAKVESDELHELNDKLKETYDEEDIEFSKIHKEFKPHITLSYSDKKIDEKEIEEIEFVVHEIVLWCGNNGDDRLFVTFPLSNQTKKESSFAINKANVFYALAKDPKAFFKQTTERRKVVR